MKAAPFLVCVAVLGSSVASAQPPANGVRQAKRTGVFINRRELTSATLQALTNRFGITMTPGRHWYDRMTGAWGYVGGPAAGFIVPGLNIGGAMWQAASNGRTGVVVNGRELHWLDVVALQGYGIPVRRGRYWLNAVGVGGYEGGPRLFNLAALARRRVPAGRGGRRRSALSTWDLTGVKVY